MTTVRVRAGGIREICARTGLSTSTVSLALRGQYGVSAETRRRVFDVAQEIGYDLRRIRGSRGRDSNAGSVTHVRSQSRSLGAASGEADPHSPVAERRQVAIVYPAQAGWQAVAGAANYGRYLRGVQAAAKDLAVDLIFLPTTDGDTDPLLQFMFGSGSGTPDGMILLGLGDEAPVVQRALTRPAPVVLLSRFVPELPCSWVSVDHVRAAELMTDHLIQQGYEQIALVSIDDARNSWQRQRRQGYLNAMRRAGLTADPVGEIAQGVTPDAVNALERLVRGAPNRTAVFVAADHVAIPMQQSLRERGLEAPRDYGLAGYDNVADEMMRRPMHLTSIGFPRERMGALALRIVRDLCDDPVQEQQHIVVGPELHVRASTARSGNEGSVA